jgi:hypothetical protein
VVACDTPQTHMSIVRALSAEPEGPMSTVPRTGPSDILFSFAELRTFPDVVQLEQRPYRLCRDALARGTCAPPRDAPLSTG